ncbi:polysaccharide biosynthesis/export family protein [Zhouia sp. PK063]|uniref:polysaccharide biosynthesis/export family protein n=1 Tax=Zhouia sp. PK063 TaxID=3373602 RepID=UPI00378D8CFC
MKKKKLLRTLILGLGLIGVLNFTSCVSKKSILYFQDISKLNEQVDSVNFNPTIRPNDLLSITVSAYDLDAVRPFNLPLTSAQNISGSNLSTGAQLQTYLVDGEGNIEFPVLGTVNVAGLSRSALVIKLRKDISTYVKNPIINVRIMNYKVSILGEVKNPGTYTISDERITVLQALGLAGDLTVYGKRTNVMVIREKNGDKQYGKLDLTKADLFDSPYYYLQQNDVVVVSPNKAQIQSSAYNRNVGVYISLTSIIISLISVLTR